jgi:hypothetical protein
MAQLINTVMHSVFRRILIVAAANIIIFKGSEVHPIRQAKNILHPDGPSSIAEGKMISSFQLQQEKHRLLHPCDK